jgi:hypothetical protein
MEAMAHAYMVARRHASVTNMSHALQSILNCLIASGLCWQIVNIIDAIVGSSCWLLQLSCNLLPLRHERVLTHASALMKSQLISDEEVRSFDVHHAH